MRRLESRIALVTGGAGDIGKATVQRLADEGATVFVADREGDRAQAVAQKAGGASSSHVFDASSADSIAAMVEACIRRYGRIDILDNNVAALDEPDTTVIDTSIETWDRAFTVNVRSHFLTMKHVIPHMLEQGGGSIINIASGAGLGGQEVATAYGASKAAVVNLGRYVAAQYGRQGVRCNTICPGLIAIESFKAHSPGALAYALERLYTPALGEAEHVAGLVAYLASDEAVYANGAVFTLDGGHGAVIAPWRSPDRLSRKPA